MTTTMPNWRNVPKVVLSAACAIATGAPQLVYGGYGNHDHLFFVFMVIVVIVKAILDIVMVVFNHDVRAYPLKSPDSPKQ